LLNVGNGNVREFGKPRGVERLAHFHQINQMVANALPFLGGRFGRADVQSAINLHRIDGNDFASDSLR
jgi:hypothetical protein